MDKSITTGLVVNSLNQAITHRQPDPGLILHSDRGCQYTSFEYKKIAEANNFVISMIEKEIAMTMPRWKPSFMR